MQSIIPDGNEERIRKPESFQKTSALSLIKRLASGFLRHKADLGFFSEGSAPAWSWAVS